MHCYIALTPLTILIESGLIRSRHSMQSDTLNSFKVSTYFLVLCCCCCCCLFVCLFFNGHSAVLQMETYFDRMCTYVYGNNALDIVPLQTVLRSPAIVNYFMLKVKCNYFL